MKPRARDLDRDVESLFERYRVDPHEGLDVITALFRELIEDAVDEREIDTLRTDWDALTMRPDARWRAALRTHPPPVEAVRVLGPPIRPRPPPPRGSELRTAALTREAGLNALRATSSVTETDRHEFAESRAGVAEVLADEPSLLEDFSFFSLSSSSSSSSFSSTSTSSGDS